VKGREGAEVEERVGLDLDICPGAPEFLVIAKFHYTDPTRTRPDPHGPARTFFAAKLRWVRAGPVGSV